jgi:adenylate cyclase
MVEPQAQSIGELVAVNGDIVGYTRLMADDAAATTETVEAYHTLVEDEVEENSGTLINFVGDNFMAVFGSATEGMRAAITIASEIEQRNIERPTHRWVRFRIGIDQGEIASSGDQYFGEALNVAARIQDMAPAGGISISGRVYRALDEPALRFRPTGHRSLKGIPEPVEVYEFIGLPTEPGQGRSNRRLSLVMPIIVVLPTHTETAGDEVRATAEVLRSDLLHSMALLPRVTVIDADAPKPDFSSGSAPYMLETGVHQVGENVRVYAKVVHMATLNVVTSHKWVTTADELFGMIDQITEEVRRRIEIELVIGEQATLYASVGDPDVVEKIYRGWYQLSSQTPEGWASAIQLFEQVAAEHPEEIYGFSLAAFANWMGAISGFADDRETTLQRAFDQAEAVIARGDPTGLAHMVHGAIFMLRGMPEKALDIIERVHITRPTCDVTYALEGNVRRYLGQWDQSVEKIDTALRLAAVAPAWYPSVQACSLFMGGRLDSAAATAEEIIEFFPNSLEALMVLTAVQAELGLERRARATAELIKERFPTVDPETWLESHPFKDHHVVERWRDDLARAGLVSAG